LESTVEILNKLLASFIDFTLAHPFLLTQTKEVVDQKTGFLKKRKLKNHEITHCFDVFIVDIPRMQISTLQ
jgi:hypothetical protein